jgi:hypothetical protein
MDGFLVEPQNQGRAGTKWDPSHEWRLAEATLSSWGLRQFTTKPSGYLVEPQNQDQRLAGRNGIRVRGEATKRRTRVGIARLASRLREVRSPDIHPMVLQRHIPKVSLVGMYLSLGFRGILVFRLDSI